MTEVTQTTAYEANDQALLEQAGGVKHDDYDTAIDLDGIEGISDWEQEAFDKGINTYEKYNFFIQVADTNNDGKVSDDEYNRFIVEDEEGNERNILDLNKNGTIDVNELEIASIFANIGGNESLSETEQVKLLDFAGNYIVNDDEVTDLTVEAAKDAASTVAELEKQQKIAINNLAVKHREQELILRNSLAPN